MNWHGKPDNWNCIYGRCFIAHFLYVSIKNYGWIYLREC